MIGPEASLIMAAVGLGIGFLALVGFAIRGSMQEKRKAAAARAEAERRKAARATRPAGPRPKFFLTRSCGNKFGLYRVYPHGGALTFLRVGPWTPLVSVETARGTDPRHWVAQSAAALAAGAAAGLAIAVAVGAVAARHLLLGAQKNPTGAADIAFGLVALAGLLAVAYAVPVPLNVRRLTRRAKELDELPADELAIEAEGNPDDFRATAANVSAVRFEAGGETDVVARLRFKHAPTGKWKMELTTAADARDAIAAFRRLVGPDAVAVAKGVEAAAGAAR